MKTKSLNLGLNTFQYSLQRLEFNIKIDTNPTQANVFVDDLALGISPVEKTVPLGLHKIRIERSGFQMLEESVNIEADFSNTFDLIAEKPAASTSSTATGKILIKVLPFADVFIDGVLIGEVRPSITQDVMAGKRTLEFVSTSLNKRHSVEVEIKAGENIEVRMNMNTGKSEIVKK